VRHLFAVNSVATAARALIGWLAAMLGLYMLAALIGSAIPRNGDWTEAQSGTTIYLYDNGIHTSILLPRMVVSSPDLVASPVEQRIGDPNFPGSAAAYPWLMVGWGDARFYRETPRWADFRAGTGLAAIVGSGEALVHVDRIDRLPTSGLRRIIVNDREYQALVGFIDRAIASDATGGAQAQPGYTADDRFYSATGDYRYSALFTCNNWVSAALAEAGVRTGRWTPLPFGVMWWY
jgi:uncharacterized protein (TIGR02117 family)